MCKLDYPKLIVSNWKEESISVQRVKQCVNFSVSKTRTPLFFKLPPKQCRKIWQLCLDLFVGIFNIIYPYEFYLHTQT